MILPIDRRALRRKNVAAFTRAMSRRHPELAEPVTYAEFMKFCERDEVLIRVVPLSRPARLIRLGRFACIQFDPKLSRDDRAVYGMHELAHLWRDDPGQPYYNAEDDPSVSSVEDFADIFAWYVTSPARKFLEGRKDESF